MAARTRTLGALAVAALGAVGACGGSPESLADGARESQGTSAATPSAPAAAENAGACVQGALRTCTVQLPTQGAVHQCFSGKQLCAGGAWTDCQDPSVLVGVRSEAFTASCPSGASPLWTTLEYHVDVPSNASGRADVTIAVGGRLEDILFSTRSAGHASAEARAGSIDLAPVLGALGNRADLTLQIVTTTTPDGAMAATARASLKYVCR